MERARRRRSESRIRSARQLARSVEIVSPGEVGLTLADRRRETANELGLLTCEHPRSSIFASAGRA